MVAFSSARWPPAPGSATEWKPSLDMTKVATVILLAISLAAVVYPMVAHARFIQAGGQKGFKVDFSKPLPDEGRKAKRKMLIGCAVFAGAGVVMLEISTFGPTGGC